MKHLSLSILATLLLTVGHGLSNTFNLIPMTHSWKFRQDGVALPAAWKTAGYDDSGWSNGRALLYVENAALPAPKNTPLSLINTSGQHTVTYYFRTWFNVTNPANLTLISTEILDDGAIFYVNGLEVCRRGMITGLSGNLTLAAQAVSDARSEGPFYFRCTNLVVGQNLLAVEVHQTSTNSSDVVFGMSLDAAYTTASNLVLNLSRQGDYVHILSAPSLQPSNEITIEAWVFPIAGSNGFGRFINKGDGDYVFSQRSYEFTWTRTNVAEFAVYVGTSTALLLSTPMPSNRWSHAAVTYTSSLGRMGLYTNGVLAAWTTNDTSGTPAAGRKIRQTTLPLVLGGTIGYAETFATVLMDEVRIWNQARSGQQIKDTMHSRLSTAPGLMAAWNFDGGDPADVSSQLHGGSYFGGSGAVPIAGYDYIHDGASAGPRFSQTLRLDNLWLMRFEAPAGFDYRIEQSGSLGQWMPDETFTNFSGATWIARPVLPNNRYYRAVLGQ